MADNRFSPAPSAPQEHASPALEHEAKPVKDRQSEAHAPADGEALEGEERVVRVDQETRVQRAKDEARATSAQADTSQKNLNSDG